MKAFKSTWKNAIEIVPVATVWFLLMWSITYLNQCESSFMHECAKRKAIDECASDYAKLNR